MGENKAGRFLYVGMQRIVPDLNEIQSQAGALIQKEAVSLQAKMDELRFEDFRITNYPVAFFDGNNDYVVSGNGKEYEIVEMIKGHTF